MSTQFEMFRVRARTRVRFGARALTAAAREADWAMASASCFAEESFALPTPSFNVRASSA